MSGHNSLLFVPSGGLANRMRAVVSAYNLSLHTGVGLRVLWFRDWALDAPFHEIFKPISEIDIREGVSLTDKLLYDRPRKKNFWIPKLFQKLIFEQRLDEPMVTPLKKKNFDFDSWARGKKSWMSCYQVFGNPDDKLYSQLFHPVDAVMNQVEDYEKRFSPHTIGFHVRRTDNAASIDQSPIELFIDAGKKEIDLHDDTAIYVATDDEPTKSELRRQFGDRLITPSEAASRSSVEGIRGGLVDMYTLAKTQTIYGSAGSSFSPMAARIGGNKLVILQK